MSPPVIDPRRSKIGIAELAIGLAMGGLAAILCIWCSHRFSGAFYEIDALDIWFDGDPPILFENFTNTRSPGLSRTRVHPLYPLVTTVPVHVLRRLGVSDRLSGIRIVLMLAAGVWGAGMYALLRVLGNRRLDATLFTLLGLSSASVIFWIGLPEYHFLGSISLILALLLIGAGNQGRRCGVRYTLASALTLSMTVTNWMLGLVAASVGLGPRRAIRISAAALCLVVMLWGVERVACPTAGFFLASQRAEATYLHRPTAKRVVSAGQAFFLSGITLPAIGSTPQHFKPSEAHLRLTVQVSPAGKRSLPQWLASAVWIGLFLSGLAGLKAATADDTLKIALLVTTLSGCALHIVYGEEVFLYSANYLPLLLGLASFGTQTRHRRIVLGLVAILIAMNLVLNLEQFDRALVLFEEQYAHYKASRP